MAKTAHATIVRSDYGEVSFKFTEWVPEVGLLSVEQVWTVIRPNVCPFDYGQIACRLIKIACRMEEQDVTKLRFEIFPARTDSGEPVQIVVHSFEGTLTKWDVKQDGRLMTLTNTGADSKHDDWLNQKYPSRTKKIAQSRRTQARLKEKTLRTK